MRDRVLPDKEPHNFKKYMKSTHSLANVLSYLDLEKNLEFNLINKQFYDKIIPTTFIYNRMFYTKGLNRSTIIDLA